MRIYHISDTHSYHDLLKVPKNIDLIIFSGDESNHPVPIINLPEFNRFIVWFAELPIKYKVFVAGNHSAAIANGLVKKSEFSDKGIIYLENDYVVIEGLKIFGSPITPTFNNWYFMKQRSKLDNLWKLIDDNTDILVTHGPPIGILDLTEERDYKLKQCGDKSLLNHIKRIKPILHCFGHIHNFKECINHGIRIIDGVVFSNGAVVTDKKFGEVTSNGNIFEVDLKTKEINYKHGKC